MRVAYFSDSLPPHTDGVVNTLCRLIDTLTDEKIDFQFFSPFIPCYFTGSGNAEAPYQGRIDFHIIGTGIKISGTDINLANYFLE